MYVERDWGRSLNPILVPISQDLNFQIGKFLSRNKDNIFIIYYLIDFTS